MTTKDQLINKLRQFDRNGKAFKKLLNDKDAISKNTNQFQNIITNNQLLTNFIRKAFKQIYQSKSDNITTAKQKNQFQNLLRQYQQNLKKYENEEVKEVNKIRKTLANFRESMRKSQMIENSQSMDDKAGEAHIEMMQVNEQFYTQEGMIQIKLKEIELIKGKMHDALRIQQDMQNLVHEQGAKLDIAEDNIDTANRNVHEAHQNLIEAQQQHMSSKKKKCCLITIGLVILLVVLVPILIKFA